VFVHIHADGAFAEGVHGREGESSDCAEAFLKGIILLLLREILHSHQTAFTNSLASFLRPDLPP